MRSPRAYSRSAAFAALLFAAPVVQPVAAQLIVAGQPDSATGALRFPIGTAPLMGLGQGGQPFDRRGAVDPMVTGTGPPWPMWYFGGRIVIPWLVSGGGWGIYFQAPHFELDLRGEIGSALMGRDAEAAYWARHMPVMDAGVNGFWPDEGDRAPAESKLARIRRYYEGPQLQSPGTRSYALFRSGFPGMQRYGGWLWIGDTWSNWDLLRKHISMGLNTSLSGVTFWGSDTGGFWTTLELSGELRFAPASGGRR